jgi:transcription antitermination factor NusG
MVLAHEQLGVSGSGSSSNESVVVAMDPAETLDPNPIDVYEGRWWVLHTRSRHEKRVAEALDRHGVNHFLPLTTSRRTYGKRVREFSPPLFTGYVFLCGGEDGIQVAWETNCIANVIRVADQDRLRADLRSIYRVCNSNEPLDLYPSLRSGRRCRIRCGPLKGIEGVVTRRRGVSRIFVAVTFICKSAVVEIDAAIVEAID